MKKRSAKKGSAKGTKRRYRNDPFLRALGDHCQALRKERDYSIDRLSKESEKLSPSVIHRLESGSGPVSVSALFRYARVLQVHPKSLLDFELPPGARELPENDLPLIPEGDPRVKKLAFATLLPVYSLKAAAGAFGSGHDVARQGWAEIGRGEKLDDRMFIAQAVGHSMEPKIHDGDWLVFRANPAGTRQGKIVLAQYRGPADPDTGGSFTVKLYASEKTADRDGSWKHRRITLSPLNPEYEPIVLPDEEESDFKIVAEYLYSLHSPSK